MWGLGSAAAAFFIFLAAAAGAIIVSSDARSGIDDGGNGFAFFASFGGIGLEFVDAVIDRGSDIVFSGGNAQSEPTNAGLSCSTRKTVWVTCSAMRSHMARKARRPSRLYSVRGSF